MEQLGVWCCRFGSRIDGSSIQVGPANPSASFRFYNHAHASRLTYTQAATQLSGCRPVRAAALPSPWLFRSWLSRRNGGFRLEARHQMRLCPRHVVVLIGDIVYQRLIGPIGSEAFIPLHHNVHGAVSQNRDASQRANISLPSYLDRAVRDHDVGDCNWREGFEVCRPLKAKNRSAGRIDCDLPVISGLIIKLTLSVTVGKTAAPYSEGRILRW